MRVVFCVSVENNQDAQQTDLNASTVAGEDFLDYGEKLVKPGELLYLPTVKTVSKNVEQHSYIVARVI
jgi:vacuolar protein sorting-associated protein 13A/C